MSEHDPAKDREYPGAPGWVKAFALVLLVLIAVFVLATVLGMHSPTHMPTGHGG